MVLLHDKGQHEDLYASLDYYVGLRRDDSAIIIRLLSMFLHGARGSAAQEVLGSCYERFEAFGRVEVKEDLNKL